jgi:pilus assembly protein Flp/PilA
MPKWPWQMYIEPNHITIPETRVHEMNDLYLKLRIRFDDLMEREEGQDLVEYALVVALIAFGATAGMSALAGGINKAFNQISTTLGRYVT